MFKVAQIFVDVKNKDRYEEAKKEAQKILAEYDSYIIAEADDSQISNLVSKGFVVQEKPEFRKIVIGNVDFEAKENREELGLADFESDDEFYVFQFVGPVKDEWRAMLEKLGVSFGEYVRNNAYVVKTGFHTIYQVTAIRNMEFIRFVTRYATEFKISSRLKGKKGVLPLAEFKELPIVPDSVPYDKRGNITVVLHDSAYMSEVSNAVNELKGVIIASGRDFIRVAIDPASGSIEKIAEIKPVKWIERYVPPGLCLDVSASIIKADTMWNPPHKLKGTDQIVAVADTGIDTGVDGPNMHLDFRGRIVKRYALGRKTTSDASDAPLPPPPGTPNEGHGTHVAGTILGNGASSGGVIRGIAPEAKLVFQSVMDSNGDLGGIPADLNDLFLPPYDLKPKGARIHNNSWGAPVQGDYDQRSKNVDEFVWDHRDMVIVIAAGNEGTDNDSDGIIDLGSIISPGTAKNCITVGGCKNDKPGLPAHRQPCPPNSTWGEFHNPPDRIMNVAPIKDDPWANNPEGMMAISSRGPAETGRIKPDLIAPGSSILSTKSSLTTDSGFWGASPDKAYMFMGGTSMATPHVSGAVAIARQYLELLKSKTEARKNWRKKLKNLGYGESPTAALIKAILIHGARKISGQYAAAKNDAEDHSADSQGRIPNYSQGFGRVDLEQSLFPPDPTTIEMFDGHRLSINEQREYQFQVLSQRVELKATLVWTDYPSEAAGILYNDLTLIVHTPDGREFHGNFIDPQPPGANFDDKNNVEKVIIANPAKGIYRIIVKGDMVMIAAPGGNGQDYALVVSGDLVATLRARLSSYPKNRDPLPAPKFCNKPESRFGPNPISGEGPLMKGDVRGEWIERMREMLVDLRYKTVVDRNFDDTTKNHIVDFQGKNKDWGGNPLNVDARVGPETSDALNRAMVGKWYDEYVTPKELVKKTGTLVVTATKEKMKEGLKELDPDPLKKIKITLKDRRARVITLLDPSGNRFAFEDEGQFEVLDKDENSLFDGKIKSEDDIEVKKEVETPFTVELEVAKTFYTFYGEKET